MEYGFGTSLELEPGPFAFAYLPHGLRVEYAWPTIARVCTLRGGAFHA